MRYTVEYHPSLPTRYVLQTDILYTSYRYRKTVECCAGMVSDGATGAIDVPSKAWWIHDQLCDTGRWEDGTKITNWQASRVLADVLWSEGRRFRAFGWLVATFLFGGGEARENGMI